MNEVVGNPRKPLVLFVDDQVSLLEGMRRTFRHAPFDIATASSANEALDVVVSRVVDVVVVDEMMPGLRGISFLTTLREQFPHITRIMLSGSSTFSTVHAAINRAEVFRFVSKPYNRVELESAIMDGISRAQVLQARSDEELTSFAELERRYPGISKVERDEDGAIVVSDAESGGGKKGEGEGGAGGEEQ